MGPWRRNLICLLDSFVVLAVIITINTIFTIICNSLFIGNDLCRLTVVSLDRLRAKILCHLQRLFFESVDDEDGFEAEIPQYDKQR
jgi:hypothetical protein